MKPLRQWWFHLLCTHGNHGPTRVKWGFSRWCTECSRLAWKRGW